MKGGGDLTIRIELLKTLTRAAEVASVLRLRARRAIRPEPLPEWETVLSVELEGRTFDLCLKHISALLALHRAGGALPLSKLAEVCGMTNRRALSLLQQLEDMGLAKKIGTPWRRAAVLTPLGENVAAEVERAVKALLGPYPGLKF
ncbi:MAG: hypothetical protein DRK00_11625 [Thermoprotei archaeon]|nr:MAG: hypothetical protein DRK00_11625 [Thermoprotei archaeon]